MVNIKVEFSGFFSAAVNLGIALLIASSVKWSRMLSLVPGPLKVVDTIRQDLVQRDNYMSLEGIKSRRPWHFLHHVTWQVHIMTRPTARLPAVLCKLNANLFLE